MENKKTSIKGKIQSYSFARYATKNFYTIKNNTGLFLGLVLLTAGFFNFSSGKYCEGNSADYYACTNPSTYYYYSASTIFFIVLGMLLIALWRLREKEKV